jgi:hypothetical protein
VNVLAPRQTCGKAMDKSSQACFCPWLFHTHSPLTRTPSGKGRWQTENACGATTINIYNFSIEKYVDSDARHILLLSWNRDPKYLFKDLNLFFTLNCPTIGVHFTRSTPILRQLPAGGTSDRECVAGRENILQLRDWEVASRGHNLGQPSWCRARRAHHLSPLGCRAHPTARQSAVRIYRHMI